LPFNREKRFPQIRRIDHGHLHHPVAWAEIRDWVEAAKVASVMRQNRVGVLGHYYGGMLDVYSDMTQQAAAFGCHFELVEMCELHALRQTVTAEEVAAKLQVFHKEFAVAPECEDAELERAARTSVALDKLCQNHNLGSLAYTTRAWKATSTRTSSPA